MTDTTVSVLRPLQIEPRLATSEDIRKFAECEGCGLRGPRKRLRTGWKQMGISFRRIRAEYRPEAAITADWCPKCEPAKSHNNPTPVEIHKLRNQLIEATNEQPTC